jgi:hypothetical protein
MSNRIHSEEGAFSDASFYTSEPRAMKNANTYATNGTVTNAIVSIPSLSTSSNPAVKRPARVKMKSAFGREEVSFFGQQHPSGKTYALDAGPSHLENTHGKTASSSAGVLFPTCETRVFALTGAQKNQYNTYQTKNPTVQPSEDQLKTVSQEQNIFIKTEPQTQDIRIASDDAQQNSFLKLISRNASHMSDRAPLSRPSRLKQPHGKSLNRHSDIRSAHERLKIFRERVKATPETNEPPFESRALIASSSSQSPHHRPQPSEADMRETSYLPEPCLPEPCLPVLSEKTEVKFQGIDERIQRLEQLLSQLNPPAQTSHMTSETITSESRASDPLTDTQQPLFSLPSVKKDEEAPHAKMAMTVAAWTSNKTGLNTGESKSQNTNPDQADPELEKTFSDKIEFKTHTTPDARESEELAYDHFARLVKSRIPHISMGSSPVDLPTLRDAHFHHVQVSHDGDEGRTDSTLDTAVIASKASFPASFQPVSHSARIVLTRIRQSFSRAQFTRVLETVSAFASHMARGQVVAASGLALLTFILMIYMVNGSSSSQSTKDARAFDVWITDVFAPVRTTLGSPG